MQVLLRGSGKNTHKIKCVCVYICAYMYIHVCVCIHLHVCLYGRALFVETAAGHLQNIESLILGDLACLEA